MKITSEDLEDITSGVSEIMQAFNGMFGDASGDVSVVFYRNGDERPLKVSFSLGNALSDPDLEIEEI